MLKDLRAEVRKILHVSRQTCEKELALAIPTKYYMRWLATRSCCSAICLSHPQVRPVVWCVVGVTIEALRRQERTLPQFSRLRLRNNINAVKFNIAIMQFKARGRRALDAL